MCHACYFWFSPGHCAVVLRVSSIDLNSFCISTVVAVPATVLSASPMNGSHDLVWRVRDDGGGRADIRYSIRDSTSISMWDMWVCIVRQHYGVTFKPTETFMPTSGHWLHTFGLRIPMRPRILEPRLVNCTSLPCLLNFSASHCIAMKSVVDKFSEIQTHMSHMLIDVLSRVLVPAWCCCIRQREKK